MDGFYVFYGVFKMFFVSIISGDLVCFFKSILRPTYSSVTYTVQSDTYIYSICLNDVFNIAFLFKICRITGGFRRIGIRFQQKTCEGRSYSVYKMFKSCISYDAILSYFFLRDTSAS